MDELRDREQELLAHIRQCEDGCRIYGLSFEIGHECDTGKILRSNYWEAVDKVNGES